MPLSRNVTAASGKSEAASSTVKLIVQGRKLPVSMIIACLSLPDTVREVSTVEISHTQPLLATGMPDKAFSKPVYASSSDQA